MRALDRKDRFYTVKYPAYLTAEPDLPYERRHDLNYSLAMMVGWEKGLEEATGKNECGDRVSVWRNIKTKCLWEPTSDMNQAAICLSKIYDRADRDRILTWVWSLIRTRLGPGVFEEKDILFDLEPFEICVAIAKALAKPTMSNEGD